jgi:hypothetical protein
MSRVDVDVHLTRRFSGESVSIFVDGREVASVEDVKTDMRTGLARVVSVPVPASGATLRVDVAEVGATGELSFNPSDMEFVAVSLRNNQLKLDPVTKEAYLSEPRGYA